MPDDIQKKRKKDYNVLGVINETFPKKKIGYDECFQNVFGNDI